MECPRKVERRSGKLEAFDPTRGQSQARVRMGENLLMLPASARGVPARGRRAEWSMRGCGELEKSASRVGHSRADCATRLMRDA